LIIKSPSLYVLHERDICGNYLDNRNLQRELGNRKSTWHTRFQTLEIGNKHLPDTV